MGIRRHGQGLEACIKLARIMLCCLSVLFLFAMLSCEKVEIPMTSDEEYSEGGTGSGGYSSIVITGTGEGTVSCPYAVADILTTETFSDTPVWTAGYVVGYVSGSVRNAVFGVEEAVQSNILIADYPGETEVAACLPVELNTDKLHNGVSLYYNPDSLGRYIILQASIQSYFRVTGLRKVKQFLWYGAGPGFLQGLPNQPEDPEQPEQPEEPELPDDLEEPVNPDNPEEPENPENPEEPEQPEEPDKPEQPDDDTPVDTIGMDIEHEEQVLDGRSLKQVKSEKHRKIRFGKHR